MRRVALGAPSGRRDRRAVQLLAEELATQLKGRGWDRVAVGEQQAGDVGVCFDTNGNGLSEHIYLVLQPINADKMLIADNQSANPHHRFASGQGKTKTEYFLRGG